MTLDAMVIRRSAWILSVVLLACAATVEGQSSRPKRIVWQGEVSDELAYTHGGRIRLVLGTPREYSHQIKINFTYIQEFDGSGQSRWISRRINWSARGHMYAPVVPGRFELSTTCDGAGSVDLERVSEAEATERLTVPCKHTGDRGGTTLGGFDSPPERIEPPKIVEWEDLRDDCSYSEERPGYRYTVGVSAEFEAILEVRTSGQYGDFVPEPGHTVSFSVRTEPSVPAYFKFELANDDVSRLPGYAMNANIDPSFFPRFNLEHLQSQYRNDDPDLLFDRKEHEGQDWKPLGNLFGNVVETAKPESQSASATVTVMDYGAVGRLRAYARYKCGSWQPARVIVDGQDRGATLPIPMDQDNNLMADALGDYKGDPGRDDEDTPEGDGTRGDGLTAFEEYRGFMVMGEQCEDPATDYHVRTAPHHKHLFAAGHVSLTDKAEEHFGYATDLSVIQLCKRHLWDLQRVENAFREFSLQQEYLDVPPETRVVNFTLAQARQQTLRDRVIHLGPQHGLFLHWSLGGIGGMPGFAIPARKNVLLGSPGATAIVVINAGLLGTFLYLEDNPEAQERVLGVAITTIMHEIGHGVGIPHHSDSRNGTQLVLGKLNVTPDFSPLQAHNIPIDSPDAPGLLAEGGVDALVIEPGAGCKEQHPSAVYRSGTFAGCLASLIVRRGQQNSGDVTCPMRYWTTDYYEPPGVTATYRWTDVVTLERAPAEARRTFGLTVDAWGGAGGDLLPYSLKVPGPDKRVIAFCWTGEGTEENARRDYHNLAGNATRSTGCEKFILVNDNAQP